MNELYLQHHGVKNQKWGLRRWQNEDGSLTPAGREHYGIGDPRYKLTKEEKKDIYNRADLKLANIHKDQYTNKEIQSIIERYDMTKSLDYKMRDLQNAEKKAKEKEANAKVDAVLEKAERFKDVAEKGVGVYNTFAKIWNAANYKSVDKQLAIVGDGDQQYKLRNEKRNIAKDNEELRKKKYEADLKRLDFEAKKDSNERERIRFEKEMKLKDEMNETQRKKDEADIANSNKLADAEANKTNAEARSIDNKSSRDDRKAEYDEKRGDRQEDRADYKEEQYQRRENFKAVNDLQNKDKQNGNNTKQNNNKPNGNNQNDKSNSNKGSDKTNSNKEPDKSNNESQKSTAKDKAMNAFSKIGDAVVNAKNKASEKLNSKYEESLNNTKAQYLPEELANEKRQIVAKYAKSLDEDAKRIQKLRNANPYGSKNFERTWEFTQKYYNEKLKEAQKKVGNEFALVVKDYASKSSTSSKVSKTLNYTVNQAKKDAGKAIQAGRDYIGSYFVDAYYDPDKDKWI